MASDTPAPQAELSDEALIHPVPDFLVWRCAGCGATAVGKRKPCNCATNVGFRKGPQGEAQQTWWEEPVETVEALRARLTAKDEALAKAQDRIAGLEEEAPKLFSAANRHHARAEAAEAALAECRATYAGADLIGVAIVKHRPDAMRSNDLSAWQVAVRIIEESSECRAALEPFARAADVCNDYPAEMSALRASFDYPMRSLGRDNDEIVSTDSVRVSDLRRARSALAKEAPTDV